MTLNELIARIKVVAIDTASEEIRPRLLDSQVMIEILLPRAMDILYEKTARNPEGLNALRKQFSVNFASGEAPLPATLKEEHIPTLTCVTDYNASYVPSWQEFAGRDDLHYPKFTVKDGKIHYRSRSGVLGGRIGNLTFAAILRPSLPALITDQVDIRDPFLSELIMFTASIINGQVPLSTISLSYTELDNALENRG